jgi:hypothetical protein
MAGLCAAPLVGNGVRSARICSGDRSEFRFERAAKADATEQLAAAWRGFLSLRDPAALPGRPGTPNYHPRLLGPTETSRLETCSTGHGMTRLNEKALRKPANSRGATPESRQGIRRPRRVSSPPSPLRVNQPFGSNARQRRTKSTRATRAGGRCCLTPGRDYPLQSTLVF